MLLVLCFSAAEAIASEKTQMTRDLARFIVAFDESDILKETYSWNGLEAKGDSFYDPFRQILDASEIDIESFMK